MELKDEGIAVSELRRFVAAGGGKTVVDPTNIGLGRDPNALTRISRLTNTHIIMGSGFYMSKTHPDYVSSSSREMLTEQIVADINIGVGDTGIRAGIVGEVGCTFPWAAGRGACPKCSAE